MFRHVPGFIDAPSGQRRGDVTNASDMINKLNPSFVLCSFQIIEPGGVAVSFNALDFTVCYDRSYKITPQLCGLSEHGDVAFITNQRWV